MGVFFFLPLFVADTDLRLRVIEHNILIISTYYKRITTERLAQMLDLSKDEVRHLGREKSSSN